MRKKSSPAVDAVVALVESRDGDWTVEQIAQALGITKATATGRIQRAVLEGKFLGTGKRSARRYRRKAPSRQSPASSSAKGNMVDKAKEKIPSIVAARLGFEKGATVAEVCERVDFVVGQVRTCRQALRESGFDGDTLPAQIDAALLSERTCRASVKELQDAVTELKKAIRFLPSVEDRMPEVRELLRQVNDPKGSGRRLFGRELTEDEFVDRVVTVGLTEGLSMIAKFFGIHRPTQNVR